MAWAGRSRRAGHEVEHVAGNFGALLLLEEVASVADRDVGLLAGRREQIEEKLAGPAPVLHDEGDLRKIECLMSVARAS